MEHLSGLVFPAALALAETRPVSGQALTVPSARGGRGGGGLLGLDDGGSLPIAPNGDHVRGSAPAMPPMRLWACRFCLFVVLVDARPESGGSLSVGSGSDLAAKPVHRLAAGENSVQRRCVQSKMAGKHALCHRPQVRGRGQIAVFE